MENYVDCEECGAEVHRTDAFPSGDAMFCSYDCLQRSESRSVDADRAVERQGRQPVTFQQALAVVAVVGLGVLVVRGCAQESTAVTQPTATERHPTAAPEASALRAPARVPAKFLAWAELARTDPVKASTNGNECYGPGDSDAGWCDGSKLTDDEQGLFVVRFRKGDPTIIKIERTGIDTGLECAQLHWQPEAAWKDKSGRRIQRCVIPNGPLSGLVGIIIDGGKQGAGGLSLQSRSFLLATDHTNRFRERR